MYFSVEFRPSESPDVFLARALKPFLEQYIWPTRGTRAFFSRHEDEGGTLIRIRMRGDDAWTDDLLKPAFEGWMRDRGNWQEITFQPDVSAYGGEEVMVWVEEHFHIGTRVVLDRISTPEFTYGDAMFDTLRLFTAIAEAAGFSREKARWYYSAIRSNRNNRILLWQSTSSGPIWKLANSKKNTPSGPDGTREVSSSSKAWANIQKNLCPR